MLGFFQKTVRILNRLTSSEMNFVPIWFFVHFLNNKEFVMSDFSDIQSIPFHLIQSKDVSNQSAERKNQFSYGKCLTGPENWRNLFITCGGREQSPINIEMSQLKTIKLEPLQWSTTYFNAPESITLKNNGHTLMLEACFNEGCRPKIDGGPLSASFVLDNIHFHWGTTDCMGSEHTIDKFAYPMEMHVVHRRVGKTYLDPSGSQFVVIAYFFQIVEKGAAPMNLITDTIHKALKNPGKPIKLKYKFDIGSLLQPFTNEYVTYNGSLTTPPCTEPVTWIVYPHPLDITKKQLNKFREVRTLAPDMRNNFRPTQPLNNRTIYFVP